MKRIGIITTFRANNYGAELQAYATQRKLRDMGYDAELIDYLFYKNRRHKYTRGSEPWVRFPLKRRIKNYLLYRVIGPLLEVLGNRFYKVMRLRTYGFEEFHRVHSRTSPVYYSQKELYDARMDYDVYMVGSDQVWNPNTATSISPHFLEFAPKDAKKISYASSFGVDKVPESCVDKYRDGLNNLTFISCRESQGVDIVKDLTGREATHVLDPTLLLKGEEWREISKTNLCPARGKYILIYNIVELEPIYQLARRISKDTGWPILKLCKRALFLKKYNGVQNLPMAGPADFLGLIDNAGVLLTNSFHGCAFAVNLETPFWAIIDKKATNNSRIESFLTLLGLRDRRLTADESSSLDYNKHVDFIHANVVLDEERNKSLKFLVDAIES